MRIALDIGRLVVAIGLYATAIHLSNLWSVPLALAGLTVQLGGYVYVRKNFS